MMEFLLGFLIVALFTAIAYQAGRRDGREHQKRIGIEIEDVVYIRGVKGEITGWTMGSDWGTGRGLHGSLDWQRLP